MSAVDIGGFLRDAPLSFSQQSSVSYSRNGVNGFYTLDAIEDQPEKNGTQLAEMLDFPLVGSFIHIYS